MPGCYARYHPRMDHPSEADLELIEHARRIVEAHGAVLLPTPDGIPAGRASRS